MDPDGAPAGWHDGAVESQWEPLPGGWSGESFLAGVGGERTVVRICPPRAPRGGAGVQVEAALVRLVRGLVPVPEVLEVRPPVDRAPGLLVTRFVPGVRGDDVVRGADAPVLRRVGEQLGRVAGTLAGIATLEPGHFVDGELRTRRPGAEEEDLVAVVESRLPSLRGMDEMGVRRLRRVARSAQEVLDEVGRTTVVHGDLHPRNVVLAEETLELRAVVDWEHAHSGSPHADLGSLLRFDRAPEWEEAVLEGWAAVRHEDVALARHRARCADLAALVDLASRPAGNLVVDLAECFLAEVVRSEDVHAQL